MPVISTVILDTLDGAAGTRQTAEGWKWSQTAIVEFPPTYTATNTAGLLQDALNAVIAITGDRGTPNPTMTVATYLDEFIPKVLGSNAVEVKITWKGYPLYQFEVGGSLSQIETNIDNTGAPIVTGYTYPTSYYPDPRNVAGKTALQGGLVSRPTPEPSFTTKFLVAGSGGIGLITSLALMRGQVNSSAYTVGAISGGPRTWMVTEANGVSKDGGNTYEGTFTIQYRAAGWDPTVNFINPDDGKPPPDLDPTASPPGYYNPQIPLSTTFPIFLPYTN